MDFMAKKIRSGVFETNSSSVHSLVFSKEGLEPSVLPVDRDGKIITDFGEFGKEYCIYDAQAEKLSYLITCLYYLSGGFDEMCHRTLVTSVVSKVAQYKIMDKFNISLILHWKNLFDS